MPKNWSLIWNIDICDSFNEKCKCEYCSTIAGIYYSLYKPSRAGYRAWPADGSSESELRLWMHYNGLLQAIYDDRPFSFKWKEGLNPLN
jgi:hypothetical protein